MRDVAGQIQRKSNANESFWTTQGENSSQRFFEYCVSDIRKWIWCCLKVEKQRSNSLMRDLASGVDVNISQHLHVGMVRYPEKVSG